MPAFEGFSPPTIVALSALVADGPTIPQPLQKPHRLNAALWLGSRVRTLVGGFPLTYTQKIFFLKWTTA